MAEKILKNATETHKCAIKLTSKGQVVHVHVIRAYGFSRNIALFVLNLCTRWRRIVSFTLYRTQKRSRHQLNRRIMGPIDDFYVV
jgi:hypothetical protein